MATQKLCSSRFVAFMSFCLRRRGRSFSHTHEGGMADSVPRRPRLRLDPESYKRLREQVLERDGWRCQRCGRMSELQAHHISSRSQLGDDAEYNLITLCTGCHQLMHSGNKKRGAPEGR